MKKANKD